MGISSVIGWYFLFQPNFDEFKTDTRLLTFAFEYLLAFITSLFIYGQFLLNNRSVEILFNTLFVTTLTTFVPSSELLIKETLPLKLQFDIAKASSFRSFFALSRTVYLIYIDYCPQYLYPVFIPT